MAAIVDMMRMASEVMPGIPGTRVSIRFEEKADPDVFLQTGLRPPIAFRAIAIRHPEANPHKRLAFVEGDWVEIPAVNAPPRGKLEEAALDKLSAALADRKAAAELEAARLLVAAAEARATAEPPPAPAAPPAALPKAKK